MKNEVRETLSDLGYTGQTIQISQAFKCLVIFTVSIDYIKQKAQTYIYVRKVANI